MPVYTICGSAFASSIPIPELALAVGRDPLFNFQLCCEAFEVSSTWRWINQWELPDGEIWLAFAKLETEYLLQFPKLADFVVSNDGKLIHCYPQAEVPIDTIRHLLLNQVIPLALSHLGKTILHASACRNADGAMAFVGMTGAGKSTLAASFALRGLPIITDDCLLVEEQSGAVECVPSYPGSRLWAESISALFVDEPEGQAVAHYSDKKRLVVGQFPGSKPLMLRAVYAIEEPAEEDESTEVEIVPLTTSEALLEIVKHTFQLDNTDRNRIRQAFKHYERVARSVPFFRLTYPRDFDLLVTVQTTLLTHFDQLVASK